MPFPDAYYLPDDAELMAALGEPLQYGGGMIYGLVDVNSQNEVIQDAYGITPQIAVLVLLADVPGIKRGSTLSWRGKTLVVDQAVNTSDVHVLLAVAYG